MGKIISVRGYANNEVAYVAWDIDGKINDCLGFEVTRVYVDESGNVMRRADGGEDRVKCAAWVAFEGQRNPNWIAQDIWPVQKLSWRDLTLRKRRDGAKRRPGEGRGGYEIRPPGGRRAGVEPRPPHRGDFAGIAK